MTNWPALRPLHDDSTLSATKLADFEQLSTEAIVKTLEPGREHCLKARPDGTMQDGHHRVYVLKKRKYEVDGLPREVRMPADFE